jgi:alpha-tubulin suppressor-like RCC1 family protein
MTRLFLVLLLVFAAPAQAGVLAGGYSHTLAVDGGKVLAWGDNSFGQLGDGGSTAASYAQEVFGLTNIISVAAGDGFSLALDSSGYVWAWGRNELGQIGDTTTTARNTPVRVSRLSKMTQIAAGRDFALAVKNDGTVWGWGANAAGQLGVAVSDTTQYFAAPFQVAGSSLTSIQKVATGMDYALALKADGSVWAWGANDAGQLGVGSTTASIVPLQVGIPSSSVITEIAARNHSMALQNNGSIWAWGKNEVGQLGDDTTTNRTTPVQVVDIADARAVAVAGTWSLALRNDGSVWSWGDNDSGQLLDKTKTQRHYPVKTQGLTDVVALTTGPAFVAVVKFEGNVLAWGSNPSGQLGDGSATDNYTAAAAVSKAADTPLILQSSSVATPIAVGKVSGDAANLTLATLITPAESDLGREGFLLIWANIPGLGNIYLNVFGWAASVTPISYSGTVTLKNSEIPILQNFNASGFPGSKVYAAYAFTPGEAPANARKVEIYAVP